MKSSLHSLSIAVHAILDCLFSWFSWMAVVLIFSYFDLNQSPYFVVLNENIWILIFSCLFSCILAGVYRSLWQHSGIGAVLRLAFALALHSLFVFIFLYMNIGFLPNPGIGIMAFFIMFLLSLSIRVYQKVFLTIVKYLNRFSDTELLDFAGQGNFVRTLVVGGGESASIFLQNTAIMKTGTQRERKILGIVDSDNRKQGYDLHGIRILGDDSKLPSLIDDLKIDEIIVAVPTISNDELRRIVKLVPTQRCKVRIFSTLSGDKITDGVRDINIGDLLGRTESVSDRDLVGNWVAGKTVLVTGGGGSIGGEICRQLITYDVHKIIVYEIAESNGFNLKDEMVTVFGDRVKDIIDIRVGSVQDVRRLDEVFSETKPQVVFHAAAYKHVPLMEECPRLAFENNTLGTLYTARVACCHNAERFIMISTDKAVNPTSVMGATKRLAELLVLGLNSHSCPPDRCNHPESSTRGILQFACVRFGNVLESNGSVIPTFKRQIATGGPVTLTHPEMVRYFMTMSEAAQLVLEAGAIATGGEIFILDMGKPVKILDLAENLIRMSGFVPNADIEIVVSGLRPGEKLYEELLLNEEGLTNTVNDKILVVKPPLSQNFGEILAYCYNYHSGSKIDDADIRKMLKTFVPEYINGR